MMVEIAVNLLISMELLIHNTAQNAYALKEEVTLGEMEHGAPEMVHGAHGEMEHGVQETELGGRGVLEMELGVLMGLGVLTELGVLMELGVLKEFHAKTFGRPKNV